MIPESATGNGCPSGLTVNLLDAVNDGGRAADLEATGMASIVRHAMARGIVPVIAKTSLPDVSKFHSAF